MANLAEAVTADETDWIISADLDDDIDYLTVESEIVHVTANFPAQLDPQTRVMGVPRIRVERGAGGTTAATHADTTALTPLIPPAAAGGGGAVSVDNTVDPPAEVTSMIIPGATIAGEEADLSSVVTILRTSVTLTDAQIKTLPTVAVEVVPAPGANKLIVPLSGHVRAVSVISYGGIDLASGVLMLGSTYVSGLVPLNTMFGTDSFQGSPIPLPLIAAGSGDFAGMFVGQMHNISAFEDQPLMFKDDWNAVSNYTVGNAGNSLTITVIYTVIDLA